MYYIHKINLILERVHAIYFTVKEPQSDSKLQEQHIFLFFLVVVFLHCNLMQHRGKVVHD